MFLDLKSDAGDATLIEKKRALINEQTSPLQRIMWVYNEDEPAKRTFENNICAFHIGNGYFLSVAHNLRVQSNVYRSIPDEIYRRDLLPILDGSQTRFLDQHFFIDEYTRKRYLNTTDPAILQNIASILKQKRFDTRWVTLAEKKICRPFLVFQFRNNEFYNDPALTRSFDPARQLYDKDSHRYTYLVEVELVQAFYEADIALYRITGQPQELINNIPSLPVNFDFLDEDAGKLYCLQSAPSGPTGRLLNNARIEGILDHFNIFTDEVGGNYLFEGNRYLIRGYFRFGSSGAPYVFYDDAAGRFVVNAVQSEASGVQLSIKNEMDGNFQYVNAIASPLSIIKEELGRHLDRYANLRLG